MADFTTTEQKVTIAKEKKAVADQAFKEGKITEALMAYHGSLMYLLGLDKNALQSMGMGSSAPPPPAASSSSASTPDAKAKEKTEVDDIIEKIYANMSACHLKNQNYKRALETADKALAKNESNFKAMFRKAKALSELGYFERAVKLLEELKTKSPADAPLADAELSRLRALDKERERANNKKLKGFLMRDKGDKKTEEVIEQIQSAHIEEIIDEPPVASTSSA
ncbi:TPR-like protein [Mycena latifolia]|nr:TPR-like protein [Mycena latifolia]